MKKLKENEGITLIALVITIIVLLILAGVSLSMVLNQDGIFSRAEQATDKYGQAKAREKLELVLNEFQITKYEEGLSGENYENRLDSKIAEVGSLIPKEDENSNYQLVIVDGHIFEIDRRVPKIVDYKGPANGVIITAKIAYGGWPNPTATVTGTITKYGGGSVVSSTATAANGVIIPSDFPTTGGSYTIPNITTDTDITITTTDSEGKTATKTIHVVLLRDDTPPTISGQEAILSEKTEMINGMKIRIKATAIDNESGLASLTYKIEPNTIKDGRAEGKLISGTPIEVEATAVGDYTVTFTAKDVANNTSTATAGPVRAADALSVAEVKEKVNESNIQNYIGTKVDYNSPEGGEWRIFYYDAEVGNTGKGEFGPKNIVYLKRDYDVTKSVNPFSSWISTTPTTTAVNYMKQMNPQWRDYPSANVNTIDMDSERMAAGFYEQTNYGIYKNTTYSTYAIGSPSVEMFMKAYNVWKTGNRNANYLVCKVENANGYSVGTLGSYSYDLGNNTEGNTVAIGPHNIFGCGNGWALSSPSRYDYPAFMYAGGAMNRVGGQSTERRDLHLPNRSTRLLRYEIYEEKYSYLMYTN